MSVLYTTPSLGDGLFKPARAHARAASRAREHITGIKNRGQKKDRGDKPPGPAQCNLITLDCIFHNCLGFGSNFNLATSWTIFFHESAKHHVVVAHRVLKIAVY